MCKHNPTRFWLTAGLVIATVSFPGAALAKYGPEPPALNPPPASSTAATTAKEKRAAVAITTAQANAMQAAVVAHGEANSALSNPYIEQKVTAPESVGVNHTKVPAGGF